MWPFNLPQVVHHIPIFGGLTWFEIVATCIVYLIVMLLIRQYR